MVNMTYGAATTAAMEMDGWTFDAASGTMVNGPFSYPLPDGEAAAKRAGLRAAKKAAEKAGKSHKATVKLTGPIFSPASKSAILMRAI